MHGSSHIVRAAAIVATAALALLTAACGGSRSSPASDSSRNAGGSTTSAAPNRATISVGSVEQCMKTGDCPHALVRQVLNQERSFAHCMRSRGVPNWPDPTIDSRGRPVFAFSIGKDDPYSAPTWAKSNECSNLMPDLPGAPFQVSP